MKEALHVTRKYLWKPTLTHLKVSFFGTNDHAERTKTFQTNVVDGERLEGLDGISGTHANIEPTNKALSSHTPECVGNIAENLTKVCLVTEDEIDTSILEEDRHNAFEILPEHWY